jgi:hypothetical protein
MSYLFPADASSFAAMSQDAGNSTFFAAIHSMFDVSQGFILGQQTGQQAVYRAQTDIHGCSSWPVRDSALGKIPVSKSISIPVCTNNHEWGHSRAIFVLLGDNVSGVWYQYPCYLRIGTVDGISASSGRSRSAFKKVGVFIQ